MLDNIRWTGDVLGWGAALLSLRAKLTGIDDRFSIVPPGVRHPVELRVRSSDVAAYQQIFPRQEYAFKVSRAPRTIVDAGANVGFASVYFANQFPDARIIAIEPEPSNFELLKRNVAPYPNVTPLLGALWNSDSQINLLDGGDGHWSFMTQAAEDAASEPLGAVTGTVPAFTVPTLMRTHMLDSIDIFKVDIEGAERELFADAGAWIDRVDALIVELHERKKPGCQRSFYNATSGFDEEWAQGENYYLVRERGCIMRGASVVSHRIRGIQGQ